LLIIFICVIIVFLYAKQNIKNVFRPITFSLEKNSENSDLAHCLSIQEFHSHYEGLGSTVDLLTNNCEQTAKITTDTRVIAFLSKTEDPIILINLAGNPSTPPDIQNKLYTSKISLTWDQIGTTYFDGNSPQEVLIQQLAKNTNLSPEIVKKMLKEEQADVNSNVMSLLLTNPSSKPFHTEIASLNNISFNRVLSVQKNLSSETIRYLFYSDKYPVNEFEKKRFDLNSNVYNFPSPLAEIRSLLAVNQALEKDMVTTYLWDAVSYKKIPVSEKNLRIAILEIISQEFYEHFFSGLVNESGINQGRYTYFFDIINTITKDPKVEIKDLDLIIKTFSNEKIAGLLPQYTINYIAITAELNSLYPKWHSFEIKALQNALIDAQKNKENRQ